MDEKEWDIVKPKNTGKYIMQYLSVLKKLESTTSGISRFYILATFFSQAIQNKIHDVNMPLSYLKIDDLKLYSNIKYSDEIMTLCMKTPIVRQTGLNYFDMLKLYPYQFEILKTKLEEYLKTTQATADSIKDELL